MKHGEISAVINKRFKKIEGQFHKTASRFEMESIHELRTEVKKLRAFLRLLNVEIDNKSSFKISKKMKTLYGYAGTIRNLQLQLKSMDHYAGNLQSTALEGYKDYLKKIIDKWEASFIEFTKQENIFHHDKKKIERNLPRKFRKAALKQFLQIKIKELGNLIKALPDDDVLHRIRKLLKDITYNWPFLKGAVKLPPLAFSKKEKIKSFTDLIGLFMDKSVGIILLETYCRDCEENGLFIEEEIQEFQVIERECKNQKAALAQIIYLNPGLL